MSLSPVARTIRRIGLVALPASLLAAGLAGSAEAAGPTVACGVTLKSNAVMTKDLYCPNGGVTLAAGVTLDMAGFKLQGNLTGTAVSIPTGGNNAVVNGRIRDWAKSIDFVGNVPEDQATAKLTLKKLAISAAPLHAQQAAITLDDSNLSNAPLQLWVTSTVANRTAFTAAGSQAVLNGEMNTLNLRDSTVFGQVNRDENQSVIVYNSTLDGSNTTSAAFNCLRDLEIGFSTVKRYAKPIEAGSCDLKVYNSTFRDNPNGALNASGTEVLARITSSTFRTNGGVALKGAGLLVEGNTFDKNKVGVSVDGSYYDSRILQNRFIANSGNGFKLTAGYVRIGNNTATGNGGYGLYAPGGYDLGGNIASGNAKGNCVGVVCKAN